MEFNNESGHAERDGQQREQNSHPDCYGLDRYSYNQGYDAKYDFQVFENVEPTLVARGGQRYVVQYQDKIGALCARDYKGVGSQMVDEGKLIVTLCKSAPENQGGGKGALIQTNKSATLGCNNTQTLFVLATQQGGAEVMEDRCPTITAAAGMSGNNQPVVATPKTWSLDEKMGQTYVHENIANTLASRDYKQPQIIARKK